MDENNRNIHSRIHLIQHIKDNHKLFIFAWLRDIELFITCSSSRNNEVTNTLCTSEWKGSFRIKLKRYFFQGNVIKNVAAFVIFWINKNFQFVTNETFKQESDLIGIPKRNQLEISVKLQTVHNEKNPPLFTFINYLMGEKNIQYRIKFYATALYLNLLICMYFFKRIMKFGVALINSSSDEDKRLCSIKHFLFYYCQLTRFHSHKSLIFKQICSITLYNTWKYTVNWLNCFRIKPLTEWIFYLNVLWTIIKSVQQQENL